MTDTPTRHDTLDPLSSILSLLRPRSYMFRAIDAAGDWSLQFPGIDGLRCYALLSGSCWLVIDDHDGPIRLESGDCLLMTRRQSFRMASDPALPPQDVLPLLRGAQSGGVATLNGGGEVYGLGGFFTFAGRHADLLLAPLPGVLHLHRQEDREALRWSMTCIMGELRDPRPGGNLMAQQLALTMLVQALRRHMEQGGGVGWLQALADPRISQVLHAMHAEPARRWTLASLARHVGLSRSALALRFRQRVGEPPLGYLNRWRMLLAGDRLLNSAASVGEIAYSLGYESDGAFSAAFKRIMGCSPRDYRKTSG
ncbi:MAG: AraC family transcriptional regulator [Bordetella sp.]|uniref:AraC family transcriptional regulator n=1 Tax=Bordetella sp. TaxID=28081 RepID=UPI003F7B4FD6